MWPNFFFRSFLYIVYYSFALHYGNWAVSSRSVDTAVDDYLRYLVQWLDEIEHISRINTCIRIKISIIAFSWRGIQLQFFSIFHWNIFIFLYSERRTLQIFAMLKMYISIARHEYKCMCVYMSVVTCLSQFRYFCDCYGKTE